MILSICDPMVSHCKWLRMCLVRAVESPCVYCCRCKWCTCDAPVLCIEGLVLCMEDDVRLSNMLVARLLNMAAACDILRPWLDQYGLYVRYAVSVWRGYGVHSTMNDRWSDLEQRLMLYASEDISRIIRFEASCDWAHETLNIVLCGNISALTIRLEGPMYFIIWGNTRLLGWHVPLAYVNAIYIS